MNQMAGSLSIFMAFVGFTPRGLNAQEQLPPSKNAKVSAESAQPSKAAASAQYSLLETPDNFFNFASLSAKVFWDNFLLTSKSKTKSPSAAKTDFEVWLATRPADAKGPLLAQFEAMAIHRTQVLELLDALATSPTGMHLQLLYLGRPVGLVKIDDQPCVIISAVTSDSIYNTLKLTGRQRAAKTISQVALPLIKSLGPALGKSGMGCLGIGIVYASKNFAQRSEVLNTQAEYVGITAALADIERFSKGDLTEDDMAAKARIFLSDRDSNEVKRVTLRFE